MEETSITRDERRCLQLWFRQALAEVEKEETVRSILSFNSAGGKSPAHHSIAIRRSRRGRSIIRQLV